MVLSKSMIVYLDLFIVAALVLGAGYSYAKLRHLKAAIGQYSTAYSTTEITHENGNYFARDAAEAYAHDKGMEYWQVDSALSGLGNLIRVPLCAAAVVLICAAVLYFSLPMTLGYVAAVAMGLLGGFILVMGFYGLVAGDPVGRVSGLEKLAAFALFAGAATVCFLNARYVMR